MPTFLTKTAKASTASNVAVGARHDPLVSGGEHYTQDVARLDKESPGWDEAMRVENATMHLQDGMPPEDVRAIFGEATYVAAAKRLGIVEVAEPMRVAR